MGFARSVTIDIFDSSATTLTTNYGKLNGGSWDKAPTPGSPLTPGGEAKYINGADNNFATLGGLILMTPASGGTLTIKWSWQAGSAANGSASFDASDLAVTTQMVGTETTSPTLQVMISNAQSLALMRAAVKKN